MKRPARGFQFMPELELDTVMEERDFEDEDDEEEDEEEEDETSGAPSGGAGNRRTGNKKPPDKNGTGNNSNSGSNNVNSSQVQVVTAPSALAASSPQVVLETRLEEEEDRAEVARPPPKVSFVS